MFLVLSTTYFKPLLRHLNRQRIMKIRKNIILFGILLLSSAALLAEYEEIKIIENISVLSGLGGNIGVVQSAEGLLLIDNGLSRYSETLVKYLNDKFGEKPRYIINTHYHGDHLGNNAVLNKHSTIIGHNKVRHRLAKNSNTQKEDFPDISYQQHFAPVLR